MHHGPDRVKAARCGIDGMTSDVLKLQREIALGKKKRSNDLRPRIDKYVDSEPAIRRKLLM